jgi:ATP-dependent Zn protease
LNTKEHLEDKIAFILAGRCSEELLLDSVTVGAQSDLKKAY